jgi:tetratricopeptide (TPR) repeat protein
MSTAAARWDAAIAALTAGETAEAEAEMRALVAAGEGEAHQTELLARVIYNRAVVALEGDGLDAPEPLLREAVALAPALPELRRGLVKLLFRHIRRYESAGAWSAAAIAAWEIATLSPDPPLSLGDTVAPLAQRLEDVGRAATAVDPLTACRLALAAWGLAGSGRTHYALARSLFVHLATGELGAPIEIATLEALVAEDPKDLVALIGLSNLHRRARRLHMAETLCRTALEHWPENPFAAARLAAILAEQGAFEAADHLFRKVGARFGGVEAAIRLSPDFLRGLGSPTTPAPDALAALREPAPGTAFVVLAGGDAGYFHRFGDALANSLAKTCGGFALHFHVVDPDDAVETRLQAMRDRLPGLPIALTVETPPTTLPQHLHKTFFACARFLHLPRLQAAYRRPVLLLDIDLVVLHDVSPLLERFRMEQADLALVHGGTRDPWCRLWADAVLIAPTERGMAYAALVRDYIAHFIDRGEAAWFLDQIALFAAAAVGFRDRAAPRIIAWPTDIQNSRTDLAYFWSLHMSQPTNAAAPDSALYRQFQQNAL